MSETKLQRNGLLSSLNHDKDERGEARPFSSPVVDNRSNYRQVSVAGASSHLEERKVKNESGDVYLRKLQREISTATLLCFP